MFRPLCFIVFLVLAAVPGFSQAAKQTPAPKSNYEKLLETPGSVVLAKKYPVGNSKFGLTVTVSYRFDAPANRFYTLDGGTTLSIDMDKLPKLISDLESFVVLMKAADGKDGENVYFRFSDKFWVSFYSYVDEKGKQQPQTLYFNPGRFEGSGKGADKDLNEYIEALKTGLAKMQDLQKRQ